MRTSSRTALALLLGAAVFGLLVTANSAGYRYGVSDQAFYIPAIDRARAPELFPRDRVLLDPQARLTVLDEAAAALVTGTGASLAQVFFAGYVLTVMLFAAGVAMIGDRLYASRWTTAALLMALTLRHRIARTGVNTFEGYFHPRVLTFAIGLVAVGLYLRARRGAAAGLALLSCLVHPTTGAWFVVWLAAALAVDAWPSRSGRRAVMAAGALAVAGALGLIATGALGARLAVMDAAWVSAFASRDYLFPADDWRAGTWLTHVLPALAAALLWRWRQRLGLAVAGERAVVVGGLLLLPVFLASVPFVQARVALAVQLQTSRVLWQIELLATVYVVWAIVEAPWLRAAVSRRGVVAAVLLALASAGRGFYILRVEHDHRLVAVELPASDWRRMGEWIAAGTAPDAHLLADPDHVWAHGSSLRVAARRDVVLEGVKDAAIAIYSRDGAMRVTERRQAIGDFSTLTETRARALGAAYAADYLLTEHPLALPLVHAEGRLKLYRLGPGGG